VQKFLVIQTAFIGDVVLATGLIEKLHTQFPAAQIDFLVRKGNEALLAGHPWLHEVLVWDKKKGKLKNLWQMGRRIRKNRYDTVINVQRFAATGLLTVFSGAHETIGFDKNPLSRLFSKRIPHIVQQAGGPVLHEIERNQELIKDITEGPPAKPRLYPTAADLEKVRGYKGSPYVTISPASVWFTKQYPAEKWIDLIKKIPVGYRVYLLGAPSDKDLCERIREGAGIGPEPQSSGSIIPGTPASDLASPGPARSSGPTIINLSGQLSFLQSAALMTDAAMNYVNDSAPMHFASSVNAPVTAVYCSTIPSFGFGPLSDKKYIVEILEPLDCRPCGLHGYRACPRGHFNCAHRIEDRQLLETLISSR
jgi:heptosyltransferase-2